jgi:hypothetical protein
MSLKGRIKELLKACHSRQGLLLWIGTITATAFVAVTTFWLTSAFILPQDNLSRLVPIQAISYLHADLASPISGSAETLNVPGGVMADEVARFTIFNNGKLEIAWLFGWHYGQPSDDDRETMEIQQAIQIDEHAWILGNKNLKDLCLKAVNEKATLADDLASAKSLANARKLANLQFLFNPVSLPSEYPNAFTASWMKRLPPIAGASRDISLDYATIFPVENSSQKIRTSSSSSVSIPIYWLPGTEVAYAGSNRTINWMPLFFGNINEWRLTSGLDAAELPHPDQIHSGPLSVSISQLSSGPVSLTSKLYETEITDIAKNVGNYLDQVLPIRSVTILPDGDEVIELVTKPNSNFFRSSKDGDSMILWNRPANFRLHLRQDEGAVILSTEATDPVERRRNRKYYVGKHTHPLPIVP